MPVAPIIIDRARKGSSLHLTSNPPEDRQQCEACKRIDTQEEV